MQTLAKPLWIRVDGTAVATGSLRALLRQLMRLSGIDTPTAIEAARGLKAGYDEQAALCESRFGEGYYRPLVRWFKVADSDPEFPDHIGLAYSKVFAQDRYQWELYYALA